MCRIFKTLDYVSAWYIKAANFLDGSGDTGGNATVRERANDGGEEGTLVNTRVSARSTRVAFVATNSITDERTTPLLPRPATAAPAASPPPY